MILSKKSRYGLRALTDLASGSQAEHMALAEIAERNGISAQYLEQIFAVLRRAGIVRSVKGPQGGYRLQKESDQITVAEVVQALDGSYYEQPEEPGDRCMLRGVVHSLQRMVIDRINRELDGILKEMTLADLEKDYLQNEQADQEMYYI